MITVDNLLIRYIGVGIINTLFGYSIFSLLYFFNMHYSLALLLATVIGAVFNFRTYGILVFKNAQWRLLLRFIIFYSILYIINLSCVYCFLFFMDNIYLVNLIAIVIVAGLGFFLNKVFVYANN